MVLSTYLIEMQERFGGEDDEDFLAELIELKQRDTVDKYYKIFI